MSAPTVPIDVRFDSRMSSRSASEIVDRHYRSLFLTGGIAAALMTILIPLQIVVFVLWPPPMEQGAAAWFELFESSPILGLLSLDLILMIDYLLLVPVMLAIHVAIRRRGESMMLLGITLFLLSVALYFASNTAVEMLALSGRFAAATSESARAASLAAGDAMLVTYQGTAFHASYIVGSIAGILIGMVMLRSSLFSRASAWAMTLGNLVGLGLYLPVVGIAISTFSGVVLWIWIILMAFQLMKLGRSDGADR